ncbi:MAG: hypothetical protein HRT94_02095 [Alphaproteobacteria bacterium]|nr:hypothetical protein [Alphaproteobacteria bacterium]
MRFFFLTTLLSLLAFPIQASEKPNYVRESYGLLRSDIQGAFPKGMWKGQRRSEAQFLLSAMPANGTDRTLQQMKRAFLLSHADTSLLKNDAKKEKHQDIFVLRLRKLMELGLYNEAFKLYTSLVNEAESSDLAELGLLLVLDKKGLSTTCLDVKVLSSSFEGTQFWNNINAICDRELGMPATEFDNSTILESLYNDKDFYLPAQYSERLLTFTPLERHMVFKKQRINYDGLEKSDITALHPQVTRFFLNDPNFPESLQKALKTQAHKQNIHTQERESEALDDDFKIKDVGQKDLEKALTYKLHKNEAIPEEWITRLYALAVDSPQNYVYIQFFSLLDLTSKKYEVPEDKWDSGISYFTEKSAENLKYLKTALDKPVKFSNNPASVYEKRLVLAENGQFQLPIETEQDFWSGWQKDAEVQKYIGLSFLLALHSDPNETEEPSDQTLKVMSSLTTVGLIEKAHLLARQYLARKMGNKEGE